MARRSPTAGSSTSAGRSGFDYALTDIWTKLRGEVVVRNELTGMAAYRVDGPLVVVEQLQGLYPDRWTGPYAIYRRYDCAGGSVLLDFETNPVLHPKRFAVSVFQHGVAAGNCDAPARPADKVLSIPPVRVTASVRSRSASPPPRRR